MDKAFVGTFCNIFMNHWEENALSASPLKPQVWTRYLDDIFVIWNRSIKEFDKFVSFLDQQPGI